MPLDRRQYRIRRANVVYSSADPSGHLRVFFLILYSIFMTAMGIVSFHKLSSDMSKPSPQSTSAPKQISEIGIQNPNSTRLPDVDSWLHVAQQVYVYSAYWDDRVQVHGSPFVRILAILPEWLSKEEGALQCVFWREMNHTRAPPSICPANVTLMMDHHNKQLIPAFIICNDPENELKEIPYAVSVLVQMVQNRKSTGYPNPVPVRRIPKLNDPERTLKNKTAVCVKPIFGPYSDTLALTEFIAYYLHQGIQKFIFFRSGMSLETLAFIRRLRQRLELDISVLPWNLWKLGNEVHDNAGGISINDCLYRYMNRFENIMVLDLDEYVAPRDPRMRLADVLAHHDRHSRAPTAAYMFVNKFFCVEYGQDAARDARLIRIPLKSQLYLRQSKEKWPSGDRSKYIMRPHKVVEAGYHQVWYIVEGSRLTTVNSRLAYLHHYRRCTSIWKNPRRTKKTALRKRIADGPEDRRRWTNASYMRAFKNALFDSKVLKFWQEFRNDFGGE